METTTTTTSLSPLARYLSNPNSANGAIWSRVGADCQDIASVVAVCAVLATALFVATIFAARILRQRWRGAGDAVLYEIDLPPSVDKAAAAMFWTNLHDLLRPKWRRLLEGQPHLSFEMIWRGSQLRFVMWVPAALSSSLVERSLSAAWPGVIVRKMSDGEIVPDGAAYQTGGLRLEQSDALSIETEYRIDPLRFIIGSVSGLTNTQGAVVQILARPVTSARMMKCRASALSEKSTGWRSMILWCLDALTQQKSVHRSAGTDHNPDRREIIAKTSELGWEVAVRYGVYDGAQQAEAKYLANSAHGLASSFSVFSGRNRFRRYSLRNSQWKINQREMREMNVVSVSELAAIAHLPFEEVISGVARAGANSVTPAAAIPSVGKVLGVADVGARRDVAIAPADGRFHLHVMGATGSGKSTLLTNLILQDAKAGRGVVVIDPKGDLIVDVLEQLPLGLANKVQLLDPANRDVAPALDVLGGDDHHLVVDNIVGIFRRIFEAYWGPRTDDLLRAACHTLLERKGQSSSLSEVPMLLSNADFRRGITSNFAASSQLGQFWSGYEEMSDSQRLQMTGPIMNKLRAFLLRDFVKQAVGNSGSLLDVSNVLDGGIFLVRIPKGVVGDETAALLGSLVVAKVWQAATMRSARRADERTDAALYVDECQNFLNLPRSFDDMLAEARGYGLSLVMAHQHLGQLSRELRDAMSTNARNKLYFTMSPEDAHSLERHFAPEMTAHDLSHLGAYQLGLRVVVNGQDQPACTVKTSSPGESRADGGKALVDRLAANAGTKSSAEDVVGIDPRLVKKHRKDR